jgi:2-keto-4-pentenoate hydratase/2-oxohepta-3-ene-1,7-dioic acid hydratase in catechol pathway
LPASFALATLETPDGERAALSLDGAYFRLDQLEGASDLTSVRALLDRWPDVWPRLEALAARCRADAPEVRAARQSPSPHLVAPIKYPNKLVCVGAVYSDHLMEFGLPPTRWPKMPIFLRPPTTSIVGPGPSLVIPRTTQEFDWEIELAVVIGQRIKEVDENTARAAIAGYSVGLDMTCRDLLDRDAPAGVDLVRAKAQDGMAPMGPVVTPAAFVPDPQALKLRLWVNDELKQDGTTANMLFSVYEQISTISQFITLEPGDVVFTGSPAGSAATTGRYLRPNDTIRAEIEGVGVLEVSVQDRQDAVPRGDRPHA